MKSYFVFTHYAFGDVCATSALCTLALHFGFGGRMGVFRRREGCLLAGPSRTPPSSCSSCLPFLLYEASPHAEVRRLRIHALVGSALPSPASTSSFLSLPMRDVYVPGRTDVFSRPRQRVTSCIALRMSSLLPFVPRCLRLCWGGRTCFPGRD